jgi:RHS repeat-associated protein
VTKSQRLTNSSGAVVSTVDVDPWGGETSRSSNQAMQPHRYTSYERDANGGDEAMFRRYESKWSRFAQPDPYEGSYDLSDPQSLNRYAYVQNDPINFVDPTGLLPNIWGTLDGYGAGYGFGGWGGGGWNFNDRPRAGLWEIYHDEIELRPYIQIEMFSIYFPFTSIFADYDPWDWRLKIRDAYNLAINILERNSPCAGYIAGIDGKPAEVLKGLRENGHIQARNHRNKDYVAYTFFTRGTPEASQITLYTSFFDSDVSGYTNMFGLSAVQARAMILLHELKHAFGDNHPDKQSMDWNNTIDDLCMADVVENPMLYD